MSERNGNNSRKNVLEKMVEEGFGCGGKIANLLKEHEGIDAVPSYRSAYSVGVVNNFLVIRVWGDPHFWGRDLTYENLSEPDVFLIRCGRSGGMLEYDSTKIEDFKEGKPEVLEEGEIREIPNSAVRRLVENGYAEERGKND